MYGKTTHSIGPCHCMSRHFGLDIAKWKEMCNEIMAKEIFVIPLFINIKMVNNLHPYCHQLMIKVTLSELQY